MYKLWAFGCSFTDYCWPTWADILGRDIFKGNYENLGISGADAFCINTQIQRVLNTGAIHPTDTVIVNWSTTHRFNTFLTEPDSAIRLNSAGNIYNTQIYKKYPDFVHEHLDDHNLLWRTLSEISSAYWSLQAVGCDFEFYAMQPVWRPDELMIHDSVEHSLSHILEQFAKPLEAIRATYLTDYYQDNWDKPWGQPGSAHRLDTHPLPAEHAEFIQAHQGRDVDVAYWRQWQLDNLPHWSSQSEFDQWRLNHGEDWKLYV